MDKSDILTCGSLSMVLLFSLLLSNDLSRLVLDLPIVLRYYYFSIYLFIYFLLALISHLILFTLCTICHKPN